MILFFVCGLLIIFAWVVPELNGNVLTVSEDDFLIPVIQYNTSGKPFMGKAEAKKS